MTLIEFYGYLYLFNNNDVLIGFRTADVNSKFLYNEEFDLKDISELNHLSKLGLTCSDIRSISKKELCKLFQILLESGDCYTINLRNDDEDLYVWLIAFFENEITIYNI